MIKNLKFFASLLAVLFLIPALTSCGGKKEGDVLSVVPADASFIYGNFAKLTQDMGLNGDEIGDPLKSAIEDMGGDLSDIKKHMPDLKMLTLDGVCFAKGNKAWIVAAVADEGKLKKYLKEELDVEFDKADGIEVLREDDFRIALKDGLLFFCYDMKKDKLVTDSEDIAELLKLGDESFVNNDKTKAIAAKIKKEKPTLYIFANFNRLATLVDDYDKAEFAAFRSGLSVLVEDANYFTAEFKITDESVEASAQLLNSDLKPAKSNFDLGAIKASDLQSAGIPDAIACIALSLPAKFCDQILTLVKRYDTPPADVEELISSIDGTTALAVNLNQSPDNLGMMATFKDAASAEKWGQYLLSNAPKAECATSGKVLRIVSKGGPKATSLGQLGTYLDGSAAGIAFDLKAVAEFAGLSSKEADLFGSAYATLSLVEGSPVVKAVWKIKNPIATLFSLAKHANQIEESLDRLDNFSFDLFDQEPAPVVYDSVAPYDPSYYDEFQPDYMY